MSDGTRDVYQLDDGGTFCFRCGARYNPRDQTPPESATLYSESAGFPSCPDCNAKQTAQPTTKSWLEIVSDSVGESEDYDALGKLHAHARLFHGRMVDVGVDGLVERARWFDSRDSRRVGANRSHEIAFSLRQQAREKIMEDGYGDRQHANEV